MKPITLGSAVTVLSAAGLATLAFEVGSRKGRHGDGARHPSDSGYSAAMQEKIREMEAELRRYAEDEATTNKDLATFDTLDYEVFSNQEWARLHESHSKEIVVNWPDGHQTKGLPRHIEDLKAMFVYAPDTQIKVHPVRFGREGFTCATGILTGTFTEPMPIGDGKFIQPTNKSFSLPMCTVGRWKDGVMLEEWLYWDNAAFMKQIGVGQ